MNKKKKTTLYFILTGVLLNGYIQGQIGNKLNNSVLEEAQKEIEKNIIYNKELK